MSTKPVNKGGRKNPPKKSGKQIEERYYHEEILLVVTILVSVLLILSVFGVGGAVGKVCNGILFGLFGLGAFVFPVCLFLMLAFHISNPGSHTVRHRSLISLAGYIAILALVQLATSTKIVHITDYYKQSSKEHTGGGLLGGLLSHALNYLFGPIGAYCILVALILICFVLLTGKMIMSALRDLSKDKLQEGKVRYQEHREQVVKVREERKAKTYTFDKKVSLTDDDELPLPGVEVLPTKETQEKKPKKKTELTQSTVKEDPVFPDIVIERADSSPVYKKEMEEKFGDSKNEATETPVTVEDTKASVVMDAKDLPVGNSKTYHQPHVTTEHTTQMIGNAEEKTEEQKKMQQNLDAPQIPQYVFPPVRLLAAPKPSAKGMSDHQLKDTASKLQTTLESFGVRVKITNISCGPTVTRYELQPEQGVKVSKITGLSDDLKLNLAAADIRIEAPIPGKAAVGIEVPNLDTTMVSFRDLIENEAFQTHKSNLAFAVGKDIAGKTVVTDIAKMPHLLIAGATGSGKSVCINTLIMSIIYKANPNDVKLIMVDPKVVELSVYNGIPHLLIPVVTDPKKASGALNWAVMEMTDRYKKFAELGVRDIKGFNSRVEKVLDRPDNTYQKMPQIVIIVDELADLMMVAPGEVEDAICRLAQMARAAGIHLILATQRPSVNVITGLIKANVPSRIAFSVSSAIDSRTILDGSGAEKLLGKGDMLFFPSGYPKPVRIQGAFISDKEVSAVVDFLRDNHKAPNYDETITTQIANAQTTVADATGSMQDNLNARDEYFIEVGKFIIEKDKASIGMLQRVFRIGFNRAARIMDQLCDAGVVGPEEGTKPRKVLMSIEEFEAFLETDKEA